MKLRGIFRFLVTELAILFVMAAPCFSGEVQLETVQLEPTTSDVTVLTTSSSQGTKEYTLGMIESLGLKRLRTSTFWPEDDGVYEGVLLRDFLGNAGMAKCGSIVITALDDYRVAIPCEDLEKWPVLLATRHEGKTMSIREKGPTRIIYPKDIGGDVALSDMRSRWIWAIATITIKD